MTGPQPPDQSSDTMAAASDTTRPGAEPLDDVALGRIVRDVAAGWEMPPVRLDQPAWRERVRTPRARRVAAAQGWLGRVGQAATAALVLTVSAALLAVWLTQPPQAAKPSESSRTTTPVPSQGVTATPLPKLLVEGDLPSPTNVVVQLQEGDYARVDLSNGTIGSALTGSRWPSDLRVRADGTMVCLCYTQTGYANGGPTHMAAALVRYDAAGNVLSRTTVGEVDGQPDPRDGVTAEQPQNVWSSVTYSADDRYAFVGWTGRVHPVWKTSFTIVDLEDPSVVTTVELPDRTDGDGDQRQGVDAPKVVGATATGRLIISRGWYSWAPASSSNPTYHFGADVYTASLTNGTLQDVSPFAGSDGCGDFVQQAGPLAGGGVWLICPRGAAGQTVIRRVDAEGVVLGDSRVTNPSDFDGQATILSPDGATLYDWNATSLVLSRVDLASGAIDTASAPTTAASEGPLSALGRWLAPSASAKVFLHSGIALSPDGSRVYTLGIHFTPADSMASSAGLLVFDARAMKLVDHWDPTADFVSVAVSRDGRFVYAAGMPGSDADGRQTSQPASITVFDATDGTIRLIAGQLGRGLINFISTELR